MTSAGIIATPATGGPAPITRQYFSAQALGMAQNFDATTWTNQVTLTFTATNARDYAVFWTCELGHDAPIEVFLAQAQARLKQDAATIDTVAVQPLAGGDADASWFSQGGLHVFTGAGAAVTLTLDFKRAGDFYPAAAARCRNARIVVLRLETGDETAESLATQTDTLATFSDGLTLAFTPASAGSYIILGFARLEGGLTDTTHTRLYDGVAGTTDVAWTFIANAENPGFVQAWVKLGLSGAQSIKLQYRSRSAGQTSGFTGARLLALRLDAFTHAYHAENNADEAGGGASLASALSLSRTAKSKDYLTIASGFLTEPGGGTPDYIEANADDPTAVVNAPVGAPRANGGFLPVYSAAVVALSAGRRTWSIETRGIGGVSPDGILKAGAVLAALQLN